LFGVSGKLGMIGCLTKKLIKSPKVVAYKIVGILKQWKKMLKVKDQGLMEDAILKLQEELRA